MEIFNGFKVPNCKSCNDIINLETSTRVVNIYKKILISFLKKLKNDFDFRSEQDIVKQIMSLNLYSIKFDNTYWQDCMILINSKIFPSYCFPIHIIVTQLEGSLDRQIIQKTLLVFQTLVFNELEIIYQVRDYIFSMLEIVQQYPNLHNDDIDLINKSILGLSQIIAPFFHKHNRDIYYQLMGLKYLNLPDQGVQSLCGLFDKYGIVYKLQSKKLKVSQRPAGGTIEKDLLIQAVNRSFINLSVIS